MKTRKIVLNPFGLKGCYVAGGAVLSTVTRTDINDFDIYPKSREDAIGIIEQLKCHAIVINVTTNAITFKHNTEKDKNDDRMIVQVILGEFPTPESIFTRFDFTVCMGAYDCDTNEYHYHECFWEDVASKALHFNEKTDYPMNSLMRLNKYKAKGYQITKPQLIKIAVAIANEGMPKNWHELESQMGGVYGRQIVIDAGDKECNLENIMEVMENMENPEMFAVDKSGDFSHLSFEELVIVSGLSDVEYFVGVKGLYEKTPDGFYTKAIGVDLKKSIISSRDFEELPKDAKFKAFKAVYKTEEGDYLPSVRREQSDVRYKVGEPTHMVKNTYTYGRDYGLFVFHTVTEAKRRAQEGDIVFSVLYTEEDIHTRSGYINHSELELKHITLHEEVAVVSKQQTGKIKPLPFGKIST